MEASSGKREKYHMENWIAKCNNPVVKWPTQTQCICGKGVNEYDLKCRRCEKFYHFCVTGSSSHNKKLRNSIN